jgi:hypothetical protein
MLLRDLSRSSLITGLQWLQEGLQHYLVLAESIFQDVLNIGLVAKQAAVVAYSLRIRI